MNKFSTVNPLHSNPATPLEGTSSLWLFMFLYKIRMNISMNVTLYYLVASEVFKSWEDLWA